MRSHVGLLLGFGLAIVSAQAARGAVLYATGDEPDLLYSIDTAARTFAPIGPYGLVSPSDEFAIGGLEFAPNGVLYGVSVGSLSRLYTLNLATGQATSVGLTNQFLFEGGLAFDPISGTAYTVNGNTSAAPLLATINLSSGAAAMVGQIAGGSHDFDGLAFSPTGQLYGVDRITNALWRIDKSNPSGAGTVQVGSGLGAGIDMSFVGGMTYDFATNTMWGYASGTKALFTIDPTTGLGTVVHNFSGPNDPTFWSLASPNVVPEPGTLALAAAGLSIVLLRKRR